MTLGPIAIVSGCKKCPAFSVYRVLPASLQNRFSAASKVRWGVRIRRACPAVYHNILEFSARVLVTDGIEFLIGPTISSTLDEFTSTWGRSLALTARGRTLNG